MIVLFVFLTTLAIVFQVIASILFFLTRETWGKLLGMTSIFMVLKRTMGLVVLITHPNDSLIQAEAVLVPIVISSLMMVSAIFWHRER